MERERAVLTLQIARHAREPLEVPVLLELPPGEAEQLMALLEHGLRHPDCVCSMCVRR